jgi:hypothetical protein
MIVTAWPTCSNGTGSRSRRPRRAPYWKRIDAFLRDPLTRIRLSDLQARDLSQWRDQRLSTVSGSTVNRELNLLSHVINVARKEWSVTMDNLVSSIRRPRNNKARARRLSIREEEALFTALATSQRAADGIARAAVVIP